MGLANRTGRTSEEKRCKRCNSESKEDETHVLLLCLAYNKIREEMVKQLKCLWGAEEWNRRGTVEKFESLVGMNEEGCEQLAKIVGAAGKKILASRQ